MKAARKWKVAPQFILTSPLRRAQETAQIAAKLFPKATLQNTDALLPGAGPEAVWKELGALKNVEEVMVVGHQPHLGRLISYLLEAAVAVDLKKGGMARIFTPKHIGPPRGVLKWMIPAKLTKGLR